MMRSIHRQKIHGRASGLLRRAAGPAVLLLLFAAEIWFVTQGGRFFYGNVHDWNTQHVELPSYMRQQFYQTGKLFPDFAMQLGGGQNIYYIAYYGLFSPVVLVSYLLPGVPMITYMTVASIALAAASILLLWRWLSRHLSGWRLFAAAALFSLAAPVMFHSHHHLMFVNYLPFMILAMEGVEHYVQRGRFVQLVVSVFLIVMSSYFFSVGAVLCLCLYWLYLYLEEDGNRIRSKQFLRQACRFIAVLILPVLLSALLWLPVLHVILGGRADTTVVQSLRELILPGFQAHSFFYSPNGMGLTAVFLLCAAGCVFSRSRGQRLGGIVFLLLMFFGLPVYVMNGGMYVNGKVLIPFLPFAALLFGRFLGDVAGRQYPLRKVLPFSLVISLAAILTWQEKPRLRPFFCADLAISMALLLLLWLLPAQAPRTGRQPEGQNAGGRYAVIRRVLAAGLLVPMFLTCVAANGSDKLLRKDRDPRARYGAAAKVLVEKAELDAREETGIWRTELAYDHPSATVNYVLDPEQMRAGIYSSLNNQNYHRYYYEQAGNEISGHSNAVIKVTHNPLFALETGVRYIIGGRTGSPVPGYRRTAVKGDLALYENQNVLPLGYVNTAGAFSPTVTKRSARPIVNRLASLPGVTAMQNRTGTKIAPQALRFRLKHPVHSEIPVTSSAEPRIVQITMKVDNSSYRRDHATNKRWGEVWIEINHVRNVLASPNWKYASGNHTFHYTLLLEPGVDRLPVRFSHGKYTVSDIQVTSWPYREYLSWRRSVSPWHVRLESDNTLHGRITAKKDGAMRISIPYDDGFAVSVDGKAGTIRKNADGFLSVPLTKGTHQVVLTFHAPWKRAGIALSVIGLLLLLGAEYRRRKKETGGRKEKEIESRKWRTQGGNHYE